MVFEEKETGLGARGMGNCSVPGASTSVGSNSVGLLTCIPDHTMNL